MIIGLVGNTNKPQVRQVIREFVDYLKQREINTIYARELQDFIPLGPGDTSVPLQDIGQASDIVVTFGGDGTILATANVVAHSGVPILGVNSGGLGFLAEVVVTELKETIDNLLEENYTIIDRMLLDITITNKTGQHRFSALNDVVVDKGLGPRLISIDVQVNNTFLNTYRSDGVIVATPTGSTAYSLSAGGPLLMPDMKALIVTPICPHSLTVRPIVLSDTSIIEIAVNPSGQGSAQINIDGKSIMTLNQDEKITIRKANFNLKWLSMGKKDFFEILRTKLHWGIDNTRTFKNV
ncbi:MAG TPA: NAD(+)/NADH kinase [bacterium]|nr:NAD(+)/NADH kinase [bacterium]HPN43101.1 NAD(+)/NADH kinase [bacterium]